jgi:hypothetical protein
MPKGARSRASAAGVMGLPLRARVVIEEGRVRLPFPEDQPPPAELIEAARANKDALRAISENRRETRPLGPYGQLLAALRSKRPELIEPECWQQAITDAEVFLPTWGAQANAFGWTERELFGLHAVPERPAANYRRLSRYDETGLIWLLRGRAVVALTETEAAIQGATAVLVYRKLRKPALGPVGDSLDDIGAIT